MIIGPHITNQNTIETTEAQKEIWLSCKIGGDDANRAYNESISIRLSGYLDQISLKKALEALYDRHSLLSCTISTDGERMILEGKKILFDSINLIDENNDFIEAKITELIEAQADLKFDLGNGPLSKITLIQKGIEDHILIFTAHHIICDGWSAGVFIRELSQLYNSYYQGFGPKLDSPPSFLDYSLGEKVFMTSPDFDNNLNYWKKEIGTYPESLCLPSDFERNDRSFKGLRLDQSLDDERVKQFKQLAKDLGVSFFNLMLSSFEILMAKTAKQNRFLIGLPAAGQAVTENYNLIGHCVHLLPLPVKIDPRLDFTSYVKARKSKLIEALEHQRITFGTLLKEMKLRRKPHEIPLVPVVFNVDLGMDDEVDFVGLDHSIYTNPRKFENFEVFLNLWESKSGLVFEWSYNPDLYKKSTIDQWIHSFDQILEEILHSPSISVGDLLSFGIEPPDVVSLPGKEDAFEPIIGRIEQTVQFFPDKVAVIYKDKPLTYLRLNALANKLARYLTNQGVKKGDYVGLVMDRSEKMIVSILGILKSGAAYLPIDNQYPISRIAFTLQDAGAKLAIIDKHHSDKFQELGSPISYEEIMEYAAELDDSNLEVELSESDPAYIIYTSGSTGNPKGVVLDHGNLSSFLQQVSEEPGISKDDLLLAVTSNSFDISIMELLLPYVHGAQCFLLDNFERRDPKKILEVIEKHAISVMFATPSHWKMLLQSGWEKRFPTLRIISGGESLESNLAEKLLKKCQSLWNIYGPTETTVFSTIKKVNTITQNISIGKPIKGTNVYVLDGQKRLLPLGEVGEIYISGKGVGQGYLNRNDLNQEKFLVDPFIKNRDVRMYRTGDLGKYDENGDLYFQGRLDQQVKFRGYRIELDEIANRLMGIDGIADAVVDVKVVNGEEALVAYLVPEGSEDANSLDNRKEKRGNIFGDSKQKIEGCQDFIKSLEFIKAQLKGILPHFMVPQFFVPLIEFPLSQNGKVVKAHLPIPDVKVIEGGKPIQDKSRWTKQEQIIGEIWSRSLFVNQIGLHDDFFEMGGHSSMAVRVMSEIDLQLGVRIPISTLFHYPTIASLARKLNEVKPQNEWSCIVPIKTTGKKKPLFIVHGAGLNVLLFQNLLDYIDKDQPLYGIQARGLNGIDPPATSIKEMAEDYVNELLSVQQKGSIELAGYSFGGVVAFEMARILKEKHGIVLDKVIMIEAYADQVKKYKNWRKKIISKSMIFWKKRIFNFKILMSSPKIYKEEKLKYYGQDMIKFTRKVLGLEKAIPEDSLMHTLKTVENSLYRAMDNHTIEPLNIKVALLKTKTQYHWMEDFDSFGWKEFSDDVITEEINGTHERIFEQDNIRTLAHKIEQIIKR